MKKYFIYTLIFVFLVAANPYIIYAADNAVQKTQNYNRLNTVENLADSSAVDMQDQMMQDLPQEEPEVPLPPVAPKKPVQKAGKSLMKSFVPGELCPQAKKDAEKDAGGSFWLWAGLGCLGGLSGYLLAIVAIMCGYMISMPVPASRILGKSSDYVLEYTMCYQEQSKAANGGAAVIGCLSSILVSLAIVGVYFAIVYSNTAAITSIY